MVEKGGNGEQAVKGGQPQQHIAAPLTRPPTSGPVPLPFSYTAARSAKRESSLAMAASISGASSFTHARMAAARRHGTCHEHQRHRRGAFGSRPASRRRVEIDDFAAIRKGERRQPATELKGAAPDPRLRDISSPVKAITDHLRPFFDVLYPALIRGIDVTVSGRPW